MIERMITRLNETITERP